MAEFICKIGAFVVCFGGLAFALAIVGFLGWLTCIAWIAFSNKFRDICKAENVIRHYKDYLEHKDEFEQWKEERVGDCKNGL